MKFATIVTSTRPRAGKTLLARLLAENFILDGVRPAIFDTDAVEQKLLSCFPKDGVVLDLDRVPDQMTLFDTLILNSSKPRIVDLQHRSFKKFFEVMRAADFLGEARAQGIEPVIFYIPTTDPESFEQGRLLFQGFSDFPIVIVDNEHFGEVPDVTKLTVGYRALEMLRPHMTVPAFDPSLTGLIEDPVLSYADVLRHPRSDLSSSEQEAVRTWLLRSFREIHHALRNIRTRLGSAEPQKRESVG